MAAQTRPRDFVINPFHPLAQGLVFASLGRVARTPKYIDSSNNRHSCTSNISAANLYAISNELGRNIIAIDTATQQIISNKRGLPLGHSTFTIMGWIYKISSVAGELSGLFIPGGPQSYMGITPDNYIKCRTYNTVGSSADNFIGISVNTWTHFAIVVDLLYTNRILGYRNGQLVSSKSLSLTCRSYNHVLAFDDLAGSCSVLFADWMLFNRALPQSLIKMVAKKNNIMLNNFILPVNTSCKRQKLIYPSLEIPTGGYALV